MTGIFVLAQVQTSSNPNPNPNPKPDPKPNPTPKPNPSPNPNPNLSPSPSPEQTGYVKLLPLVPDKFLRDEWVPFGMSDVLLGPSVGLAMTSREPVSSIDRVRIDTDGKLTLLL